MLPYTIRCALAGALPTGVGFTGSLRTLIPKEPQYRSIPSSSYRQGVIHGTQYALTSGVPMRTVASSKVNYHRLRFREHITSGRLLRCSNLRVCVVIGVDVVEPERRCQRQQRNREACDDPGPTLTTQPGSTVSIPLGSLITVGDLVRVGGRVRVAGLSGSSTAVSPVGPCRAGGRVSGRCGRGVQRPVEQLLPGVLPGPVAG
jgi:hypothetical protein